MLNIKNPGTHSLAGERATRRGENLTTADDIMALVQSIQPHLTPLEPGEDPTAFLFDPETGLPRLIVDSSAPVAVIFGEPLLFKGDDFSRTDIVSAL